MTPALRIAHAVGHYLLFASHYRPYVEFLITTSPLRGAAAPPIVGAVMVALGAAGFALGAPDGPWPGRRCPSPPAS